MLFKNYVNPKAPDDYFAKLNEIMNTYDMWSYNGMFKKNKIAVDKLLNFETQVHFDATAKKGKFPLILYCSGWFSRSPDNTLLAEFLASHGYVVATIPQLGTGSTIFDFKINKERVMTQVLDLQFALETILRMKNLDSKRVGSMGFSVGGIVSLWLSQRDKRVKAIVGLDASYIFDDSAQLAKENVLVKRQGFPILTFYRGHEKQRSNVNLNLIKSLNWANRLVVGMPKATHGEFSDEPYLLSQMNFEPWPRLELNSHDEALSSHYLTIKLAKLFFDGLFLNQMELKELGVKIAAESQKERLVYEQYLEMD
ncbi:MAG: prolyl oligopeptidase family serine peptidase [Pyrinomonadaceae bacterium]|nr:prolyl oligopeptidase family serine peptidase [Pyrinomonadaceae bacterium]